MSVDFKSLLFDRLYDASTAFGVAATLTPFGGDPVTITVVDRTDGVDITGGAAGVDLQSVKPVACVRAGELADNAITLDTLRNGTITFNGATWLIHSHLDKPTSAGAGEVWLVLKKA